MYQIFVDRFSRTPRVRPNPAYAYAAWGSRPTRSRFLGGTLRGVTSRLDYLHDLGVTLLYLTPIFLASSNHRYNVYDYYKIDPRLGSLTDFDDLITHAHGRGMRVILDGVFNHCGRGFFPFYDVMENGKNSAYGDWFHVRRTPVDAYGEAHYRGWQDRPLMPILNLSNPHVQAYFLDVARYWTARGIDGWRLDAVGEVRGHAFWKAFRQAVREVNPEAYLLAEFWGDGKAWLTADQFDGGTNYVWREAVLGFTVHRTIQADAFARKLEDVATRYPWPQVNGMANLLGSHDTPRLMTIAKGDVDAIRQAMFLQFCFPGIPTLYYGDELGLEGGNDPDNRRAMPWSGCSRLGGLYDFVQQLASTRQALSVLRHGDWRTVFTDDPSNICIFRRRHGAKQVLIVLHHGRRPFSGSVPLPGGRREPSCWTDVWSREKYHVVGGQLQVRNLPPRASRILVPSTQLVP